METETKTPKVLIPIANGTEPMEAIIMIDVLRLLPCEITVASVEEELLVDTSYGIKIHANACISNCADSVFDLIALPGGMPGATHLRDCVILETLIKQQAANRRLYAAVGASPAVALGAWGVPNLQVDGRVVTSRGPTTTMEFAVELVKQLCDERVDDISEILGIRRDHVHSKRIIELNPVRWAFGDCPKILIPIANGSEGMEAVVITAILRRANMDVVLASIENEQLVITSSEVKLVADMLLDAAANFKYDLIVLPGGYGGAAAFSDSKKLVNLLRQQRKDDKPYGAIGESPGLVLQFHGLLEGKKATVSPLWCELLGDDSEAEYGVVVDGKLITCQGPGTIIEFANAIVERLIGLEFSVAILRELSGDTDAIS